MKVFTALICMFLVLTIEARVNIGSISNYDSQITATILAKASERIVHLLELNNGERLKIRITLPENYDHSRKYPVLLGPGLDEGNLDYGCRYFGEDPGQYGWILVESLVHMKGPQATNELLDFLEEHYKIEGFHLLGFSANSVPQYKIAEVLNSRISSVTSMPGQPDIDDPELATTYKNTKILMLVGERDHWWKKKAIEAERKLRGCGLSAKLLVVPNGGHILDEFSGEPLFTELNNLRDGR